MTLLAPTLEAFFTQRLMTQLSASPHTIASYRDSWRLLLGYVHQQTGTCPSALDIAQLDAPTIGAFLTHLEVDRGSAIRTRNLRLAAIHSLFRFAALHHPEHAASIQRVLAIPQKRYERTDITFLNRAEIDGLLAAPDPSTRIGRRDHALLRLAIQTGLRVSELAALHRDDVHLDGGGHVTCHGKGRKARSTPLTRATLTTLQAWLAELPPDPDTPLFPGPHGGNLSRDAIRRLVSRHHQTAKAACPTLQNKQVSPHVLRHTCAMALHAGVDLATIALWLGHEGIATTQIYLHADMTLKEHALARTHDADPTGGIRRYNAPDSLLAFLQGL